MAFGPVTDGVCGSFKRSEGLRGIRATLAGPASTGTLGMMKVRGPWICVRNIGEMERSRARERPSSPTGKGGDGCIGDRHVRRVAGAPPGAATITPVPLRSQST